MAACLFGLPLGPRGDMGSTAGNGDSAGPQDLALNSNAKYSSQGLDWGSLRRYPEWRVRVVSTDRMIDQFLLLAKGPGTTEDREMFFFISVIRHQRLAHILCCFSYTNLVRLPSLLISGSWQYARLLRCILDNSPPASLIIAGALRLGARVMEAQLGR